MTQPLDIAIIGLSGAYAGAPNLRRYWQNILDKVDAVGEAPPGWSHDNLDPESDENDRIYTSRGGFLGPSVEVDPMAFGVLPSVAQGGDPDHLIALMHARDALIDAGYDPKARGSGYFNPECAGVIIGRGTYGNRGMASMIARGLFVDQAMAMARGLRPDLNDGELAELRKHFKSQLPPYNAEMVGPLTPNAIAGLIANRLDLMGPSYIVDAACASTMMALDAAAHELASGRCDLMITGGVHTQTPAQLYIQFCQIQALSRTNIRPFQQGADGTLLGEGIGMLVLKRRADAERDGNRIYAVIKGIGTSSDGRAKGLLTPRLEGQVLALQRAYANSGINPLSLGYVEAHGTGTAVGDRTEIDTLRKIFGAGDGTQIGLGSVKSMIGHCLPAAGSASMIKTALALHHKLLPPMLCDKPDPALNLGSTPFYINNQTRPWIHGGAEPRRAGVNAFGFGGVNAHVILEEHRPQSAVQVSVLHRPAPSELLLLAADSPAGLLQRAQQVLALLRADAMPELGAIVKAAAEHVQGGHRLAIVADNAEALIKKLDQVIETLGHEDVRPFKSRGGIHYGASDAPGKVCFVYPGEGAQYPNMLADICLHFPQVREWFDFMESNGRVAGLKPRAPVLFPAPSGLDAERRQALEAQLYEMDVAAEGVFCAALGLNALLESLGLKPDAMLGHSTGENTAFTACGVYRAESREQLAESVHALNRLYRKLEGDGRFTDGTLLTVGGLRAERREQLLAEYGAENGANMVVAMDNCPNQLVLFGEPAAAEQLRRTLAEDGAICAVLPFGRAYHTPLFKPMADAVREYFGTLDFGPGRCTLYSACSAAPFPDEPDAIRDLTARQWQQPVRFTDTIRQVYDDGYRVFVEVGPSANLTAFIGDTLRDRDDVVAVSCDSRRRAGVLQLHQTLAALFAAGVPFNPAALYQHRVLETLDLDAGPAAPARRGVFVKLDMPKLTLPDNWAPLQRPAAAAQMGSPSVTTARSNVLQFKPPAPEQPAQSTDPRMAMLQSHFALMQDFLDSQARVLQGMTGGATQGDAARPIRFPLLGRVTERDETHLIAERVFDIDGDRFLRDHAIGGRPSLLDESQRALAVVPFTFSMEIAAEAAVALLDEEAGVVVTALEDIRGSRWLSLDGAPLRLRIVAERIETAADSTRVAVRLYALDGDAPATGRLVFETAVILQADYPSAPEPRVWRSTESRPPRANPDGELYARGMFHGPRLQGVKRIRRCGEQSLDADLETLPTDDYFSFTAAPRFELDAALLDAAGALVAYWVSEQENWKSSCFPFYLQRYRQFVPPQATGRRLLGRVDARIDDDGVVTADLDVIDETDGSNQVLMRAERWQDRKFAGDARYHAFRLDSSRASLSTPVPISSDGDLVLQRVQPFEEGFLEQGGGIWMRVLAHMVLNGDELPQFYALPARGPRREEWLMGRIAVKDAVRRWASTAYGVQLSGADIAIHNDSEGKPLPRIAALSGRALPEISISHSQRWGLGAAASAETLGVDYQRSERVDAVALSTGALDSSEQHWVEGCTGDALLQRVTALWCAKEAAAKASGHGLGGRPQDWRITHWNEGARCIEARVRAHGTDFDVTVQRMAAHECLAVCRTTKVLMTATRAW